MANRFADPNWWASHLHEAVAGGNDGESQPYLNNVFGTTSESLNRYWKETMMDNEYGEWPQVHIGLPRGHVVSVVYFGNPRYEVEYRYGTPEGESVCLAVEGPTPAGPGFRWTEVKAISSLVSHIEPIALLLLIPAATVSAQEEKDAILDIHQALSQLGYSSPVCMELAEVLVVGLYSDMEWFFDESYGWVTNSKNCPRCPTRPQYGLGVMPNESFLALKNFTKDLGLNPNIEIGDKKSQK